MVECANCGASLDDDSRFCPRCGERVARDEPATRVLEVPPAETGEVPVHVQRVEPRLYGVTPAGATLALGAVTLVLAVVLFAIGRWPIGLILVGLALLLALASLEAARRRPEGALSRTTERAAAVRRRAGVAAESFAVRGRATRELVALRRELQRLTREREEMLSALGDAVYRGDEHATERARQQVDELDRQAAEREAEMQAVVERARQRIERGRFEVQPTEVAERPEEPAPGELNPPEPARIPEPYPPPDEGNPPQPAVIPEPGPAVIPEPGPVPPASSEEARP